jgi:ribosomal protein L12E/L44/L45/RPP1/RPP2
MKTIIAAFLAVAFLASTPAFAGDEKAEKDKAAKKDDKKKDEKKAEKPAGGGW